MCPGGGRASEERRRTGRHRPTGRRGRADGQGGRRGSRSPPSFCTDGTCSTSGDTTGCCCRSGPQTGHRAGRHHRGRAPIHALADRGLALENRGHRLPVGRRRDLDRPHGTGLQYRNLSSPIVGLRLVTGDGEVLEARRARTLTCSTPHRVGVGALGILSQVTLQCVPAFNLHAVEEAARIETCSNSWDELVEGNDHFEFLGPGTRWALTKRNRRTNEPARPRPPWASVPQRRAHHNVGFDLSAALGERRPVSSHVWPSPPQHGPPEYVDPSYKVFASKRCVRFYEMEYAVPREAFPVSAFAGVRRARRPTRRAGRLSGRMPVRRR